MSAVVAVFMCMCLLLYVSFSAYVSGCYSRSSSSSHTAIGGITQPFVPNLLPNIYITAIHLASVPADMMHQISIGAIVMGMHLQSSSDEDGEDEADEMQDDEMMKDKMNGTTTNQRQCERHDVNEDEDDDDG